MSVDALTNLGSLSRLWPLGSLSPDGRWLTFTFRAGSSPASKEAGGSYSATGLLPDYATGTDAWVADTRTGATQRVTDGKGAVEEPVWSPDGKEIAFYADRDGAARIWVWNRETQQLRRVSEAIVRPSFFGGAYLKWMPNGKALVALVLPDGMTVKQADARAVDSAKPAADDPTVTPGATVIVRRVAAKEPSKGSAPVAPASTHEAETPDTSHLFVTMESDVALVDVATGAVRRLGSGKAVFWDAPSPDGKWIAFTHQSGRLPATQQAFYDLEVAPAAGGPTRLLSKFTKSDYGFCAWSPDSTRLAYVAAGTSPTGDVHVVDVAASTDRNATTGKHPDFGDQNSLKAFWTPDGGSLLVAGLGRLWRVPSAGGEMTAVTPAAWDREVHQLVSSAQTNVVWTLDGGRTVTVVTRAPVGKNMGFFRVQTASGRTTKLRDEARQYGGHYSPPITSGDGSMVVWSSEDAQHPPDLWGAGPDLAARQLSHLNPGIEKLRLGSSRVIDYLGPEGTPLAGALLLPSDYREGTRVPLVVRPYPGPFKHSDNVNRFGLEGATEISNMQMLATRGYAVLFPETPQRLGTPMKDLAAGVNAAVNRVIELGIADPERLAIVGQSYGGYSTVSVITQTQRFKAAAMSAGLADLVSYYGSLGEHGGDGVSWSEAGQGLLGGTPWEYRNRYVENSPIFYLDRVTTPLLILHGNRDTAVPIQQAEEVFVGLRRLGKEVEYRKYIGEEHAPEGRENLVDYWNAIIRWFDTHLRVSAAKTAS